MPDTHTARPQENEGATRHTSTPYHLKNHPTHSWAPAAEPPNTLKGHTRLVGNPCASCKMKKCFRSGGWDVYWRSEPLAAGRRAV